jgi:hypothetical protein
MIRIAMAVVTALAMNGAQARDNGYFREGPEVPEPPAATAKASATCSLWARYDAAYPVAQTLGFLGAFSQCYPAGYETAADAAAAGLPSWRSFGYKADGPSVGPSSPSPGQVYECSVNVNFDPISAGGRERDFYRAVHVHRAARPRACRGQGLHALHQFALRWLPLGNAIGPATQCLRGS